jgi:ABC-type Mn2+/Zn2+ transport system permease subunit
MMAVLDAVIVMLMLLFYDKFLVISFQPELARLRGIRVGLLSHAAARIDLPDSRPADPGGGVWSW